MVNDSNIFEQYAELVRRFKSGDESAFTDIYENSKKMVYVTCLGILNNEQDAEDAMQEAYITVYEKIGTLDNENTFVTWLKTIAANKARDKFKAKKNESSFDDVIATEDFNEGDDNLENLPDSLIMEKDKRDTFYKIMRKELSDEQFQTTLLYYYDELPVAQIAQIMDCPENTVKSKLRLARIKIKSGIEEYERKNNISILGAAAGTGSLGTFFNAFYGSVKVPAVKGLPVKVGAGAKSAAGKAAAKTAAKSAAKTGAKVGHAATGATAKAAATSSLPKVLAIVGASVLGVGAIGGAILVVTQLNKGDDEEDNSTYEIEYDGLYCNIDKSDEITKCLRFYSDGKVISTDYEYDSDNYFPQGVWFNLDSGDDRVEEGTYKIDGSKITVTFEDEYSGYIMQDSVYIDDTKYKYYEFGEIDGYEPIADTSDPAGTGTTDPSDTAVEIDPISGAYLEILNQYKDEILTYETLSSPSINYIDVTDDGIKDLMFLYCSDNDTSNIRLAYYSYDSSTDAAVLLMDRDVTDGGGFRGAALLDNGNIVCQRYYEKAYSADVAYEELYLYEVELNGGEGSVIDEWAFYQSGDAYHNGLLAGYSVDWSNAADEYRSRMVFPIMPDNDQYAFFQNASYSDEHTFMSRAVFELGDYYYFNDLVALLGGDAEYTVTPTSDTTPVVSFTADMKNAYLDIVNSITADDFSDSWGYVPDADEFYFNLVYITDDDIPELVCSCTEYASGARYTGVLTFTNIYTFKDGELIELCHALDSREGEAISVSYYYKQNFIIDHDAVSYARGYYEVYYVYLINPDFTVTETDYNWGNVVVDNSSGFNELIYDESSGMRYYICEEIPSASTSTYVDWEYTEITEEEFLSATIRTGEAQSLVATKTAEEITAELT